MSPVQAQAHSLTSRRTASYIGTTDSTSASERNDPGYNHNSNGAGLGTSGTSPTHINRNRSRSGSSSDSGASRRNSHTGIDLFASNGPLEEGSIGNSSINTNINNIVTSYFAPKQKQKHDRLSNSNSKRRRFAFPFRRRRSSTVTPSSLSSTPTSPRRGLRRYLYTMMTSATFRRRLAPITQRLPMLSHFGMIPFALLGPRYIPWFFGVCLILVHCMLMTVNIRTIWGAYLAWRGVSAHSAIDWRAEYASRRRSLTPAEAQDVLMFDEVEHLIFCPNYAEDVSVLRETLYLLSTQPGALTSYHPVLAMEAREKGSAEKAQQLIAEFRSSFKDIGYTLHPGGIEGEAAGKSSNLAWAVRQAWNELKDEGDEERIARIVVTVIDSDTALAGDYFSAISCKFAFRSPLERQRCTFVPPICFDRNAHDVPVSVRVTDIMWALAGLSSIYPGSGAKIPTSAYSLSMSLAADVGFHDAGPQAIGEDMHMYIKCLFSTGGNLITETIYSPASQLDVVAGERGGIRGFWNDHVARYKQAIRHMWGSLDTGYGITRLINRDFQAHPETELSVTHRQPVPTVFTAECDLPVLHAHSQPGMHHAATLRQARPDVRLKSIPEELVANRKPRRNFADEDFATPSPSDSSVTSSSASVVSADDEGMEETDDETSLSDGEDYDEKARFNRNRVNRVEVLPTRAMPFVSLCFRLYEAHLLMGHMLLLVALRVFTASPAELLKKPSLVPPMPTMMTITDGTEFVSWAYALTDSMKSFSLLFTVLMFVMYDRYHAMSVQGRWANSQGRLGVQSGDRSFRPFPISAIDYLALPAGIVYGVIPILHAQFMHLFTDRLVYTVSFKPKGNDHRKVDVEKAMA